jgi:arylsulfatase A-like enzyme
MFPKLCCFHLLLPASLRSLLLSCIVVLCPAAVVSLGYCEDATPPEEDKGASEQEQHSSSRPNFLVIITDDQRHDAVGAFMPRTQRRIFDEGVAFERGYITTSACAPSRASVLTGLYARNHGVRLNSSPFTKTSIAQLLQSKGYHTGLVGKYINTSDGGQAPGYDYWVSMPGGSGAFINPLLVVGKERSVHPGYVTHLFREAVFLYLCADCPP